MRNHKTPPYGHIESVSVHSKTRKVDIKILLSGGIIRTQSKITTIPLEKITTQCSYTARTIEGGFRTGTLTIQALNL